MAILAFMVALVIITFNVLIFVWRPRDIPCTSCDFYNSGKCPQIQQRLDDNRYGDCFGYRGIFK